MLSVMQKEIDKGSSLLFQGDLNHFPTGAGVSAVDRAGLLDALA